MTSRYDSLLGPQVGVWFENDLRNVRSEVVEFEQPPRNGFEYIPQDTSEPEWIKQYEHRMYEPIGVAQFISNFIDDLPLVDISTHAEVFNARPFGCAYKYDVDEIAASQAKGMQLDRKRGMSARLVTEQKFNRIMFYGDPATQLFGLLNYPFCQRRIITVPFDSSSTPQDVLDEMNAYVNSVFNVTETIGEPDFLGMPPAAYTYVSSRKIADTDTTILGHFMANNPFFKEGRGEVVPLHELKGAGPNGNDVMVLYRRDPLVLAHKLVRPFTQEEAQPINLAVRIPCHAKSGGIASDRPLEISIAELPTSTVA